MGRFFGVVRMVMARPRMASWLVRSMRGSMCPCAGYGITNMCVFFLFGKLVISFSLDDPSRFWIDLCVLKLNKQYITRDFHLRAYIFFVLGEHYAD